MPSTLYERIVARRLDDEALRWLIEGFETFDRAGGELSLERCLRLPTPAQRRRTGRDVWLRAIAACIGFGRPVPLAREVSSRLSSFMQPGPW